MRRGRCPWALAIILLFPLASPASGAPPAAPPRDTVRRTAPAPGKAAVAPGAKSAKGAPAGHPAIAGAKGKDGRPSRHPTSGGPMGATPSAITPRARAAAAALKVKAVAMRISHRVFPDFRDAAEVALRQEFPVGDGEYTARILEWVPDFAIDIETHRIGTRSAEPKNPAFRILVRKKGVPQDTTWAFLNMPPHFARRSMLAFQVVRVDFEGRPSVTADTSRSAAPATMGKR